ncbi:hypothetical protein GOBAR_DD19411 [Gossypium barbadense]|nr:hypothetical protein GOBAR_DD19411 [Gossypium barbadense]
MSLILKRHPSRCGTNHILTASRWMCPSRHGLCQPSLAAPQVLNMGNSDTFTIPNLDPLSPSMVTPLGLAILAKRNTSDTTELGQSQHQFWTLMLIYTKSSTLLLSLHNLISCLNKTSLTSSLVQDLRLDNPSINFCWKFDDTWTRSINLMY